MNFSIYFKTRSWQSVLSADVDAAIQHDATTSAEERRISLIDLEASADHVLMLIGARNGRRPGPKHLITGGSARLQLRAAPHIRFDAGITNFWQRRNTLNLSRPSPRHVGEEGRAITP